MPGSSNRPRRRRIGRVVLIALAILTGLALVLGGLASCRPAWYRPASIDHARLQADQADLVRLADAIGGALNAGEAIEFRLPADQINRWLAARRELFPEVVFPELDRLLARPMVTIEDGALLGAALVEAGGWPMVLSAALRPRLLGEHIEVELADVRMGRLSAPQIAVDEVARALRRAQSPPDTAMGESRIRLPRRHVWPNGKRRFQVALLELADGAVRVRLEPE